MYFWLHLPKQNSAILQNTVQIIGSLINAIQLSVIEISVILMSIILWTIPPLLRSFFWPASAATEFLIKILVDSIWILFENPVSTESSQKNYLRRGEMFSRIVLIRMTLISITLC